MAAADVSTSLDEDLFLDKDTALIFQCAICLCVHTKDFLVLPCGHYLGVECAKGVTDLLHFTKLNEHKAEGGLLLWWVKKI